MLIVIKRVLTIHKMSRARPDAHPLGHSGGRPLSPHNSARGQLCLGGIACHHVKTNRYKRSQTPGRP